MASMRGAGVVCSLAVLLHLLSMQHVMSVQNGKAFGFALKNQEEGQMQFSMDSMGNMKSETHSDHQKYLPWFLFPGPLVAMGTQQLPQPFVVPDPLVLDMIKPLGEEPLKLPHRGHSSRGQAGSCQQDIAKFCSGEHSPLLCLGRQLNKAVSKACRKDVDKSVPFRCSRSISRLCNVTKGDVLTCLDKHADEIDSPCWSAVTATELVLKEFTEASNHVAHGRQASKSSIEVKVGGETDMSETSPGDIDGSITVADEQSQSSFTGVHHAVSLGVLADHYSDHFRRGMIEFAHDKPGSMWWWQHRSLFLVLGLGALAAIVNICVLTFRSSDKEQLRELKPQVI
jgi:hypothetical protein